MTRHLYRIAAALLLTAPTQALSQASVPEVMDGATIRETVAGNTTIGTFADRALSYVVFVAEDGRLIGRLDDGTRERIELGRWSIHGDRLVGEWDNLKEGEPDAFEYRIVGENVHAYGQDGMLDRIQFFVDGDPYGLQAIADGVEPEPEIRATVERWISLWNAGPAPIDAARFADYADLFAPGEGYLAVDDFTGEVLTLRGYPEYAETWAPVMEAFTSWSIERVGEIDVDLSGDTAVTFFRFRGEGILTDGASVGGMTYATLVLRREADGWRIVHEHLTGAEE
ncbi:nuclear transport factor 2 family protein [uncultured Roseobacter sp.]|uniref:YybH family protein n=1 Tax=uncultured Roseobacter sp. TaxID=114847 RepID=UPI0026263837|nr:nuclear transport factor 2 family protein [uncultured Roseobacter sp.]